MTREEWLKAGRPSGQSFDDPAASVELRDIATLVPFARNSRTHSREQIDQIARSMKEWGWTNPVLIDEGGMIIAGHARIEAGRILGLERVPVMIARGWSDAQKRAYVIADNQLALGAGWDPETLRLELHALDEQSFELALVGFSAGELSLHMFDPDFGPGSEEEQARLDRKKTVVCPSCKHEFTS